MTTKRTVLITGCSDGGLGAALALAFHASGWRVFASARNLKKLSETTAAGIESVELDVLNSASIEHAVTQVKKLTGGSLDALVCNAGGGYNMPVLDIDMQSVRDLFELNVFSNLALTQAFTPLLLKSKSPLIAVNTSIASILPVPNQAAYNASKAAAASFTNTMRLELQGLGIKVVELKTGAIKTNFFANVDGQKKLPANSLYAIARKEIDQAMTGDQFMSGATDRNVWAKAVVGKLSKKTPAAQIWEGSGAFLVWLTGFLPLKTVDGEMKKAGGLDAFEKAVKARGLDEVIKASEAKNV